MKDKRLSKLQTFYLLNLLRMKIENYIRIVAWTIVLITSIAWYFHHEYWLFVTMFVWANLLQFGFTWFCPLKNILKKFWVKE